MEKATDREPARDPRRVGTRGRPRGGDAPLSSCVPELERLLDRLLDAALGGTNWRVPADAAEDAYDRVIVRLTKGMPPANLEAWSRRVLINNLRSGPGKVGLSRQAASDIAQHELDDDPKTPRRRHGRIDQVLDRRDEAFVLNWHLHEDVPS